MTIRHRYWHFWIWMVMAPIVFQILILSQSGKPRETTQEPPPAVLNLQTLGQQVNERKQSP